MSHLKSVISHLELQLHAGDIFSWFNLCQPLDVGVQVPCGDLCVPAGDSLQHCIVNEYVLVLRLDHVVPLGAHQRDVAVDVDGLFMLDALCHGVDHDEAASAADSSTKRKQGNRKVGTDVEDLFSNFVLFLYFWYKSGSAKLVRIET